MVNSGVMKILKIIVALLCMAVSLCSSANAATINRRILAVYDSTEVPEGELNRAQRYAAMPLEHLGFIVDYLDANERLPDDGKMAKYHGIITWLADNQLKNAADYGRWLTKQVKQGKKLVVIDDFGFYQDEKGTPVPEDVSKDFYEAFGAKIIPGKTIHSPLMIELVHFDPEMTEFERKLGNDLNFFDNLTAPGSQVYLKLKRKDTGTFFDAIFISPKGGAALGPYALYYNKANEQTRWRINPFKFFAKAFGSDFPKPDVSTMNGMRLFYSHIDGDGLRNESKVFKGQSCAEVMHDKIFLTYKLPITASIIIGDILLAGDKKGEELVETIRKMYELPNIDAASHGWSHPAEWKKHKPMLDLPGYTYSPENEIGKSIAYINDTLVPKDKKTNIFFWTGDCEPDYEALKYVYDNNLRNINGGDTRFDRMFPSYTYVAPLFRMVGDLTQVLASDSNEYVYTDYWRGPFYGYKYVIQTFENTETPMRLRPINVYYHFYSMEYDASIKALNDVYAFALKQEIFPVFIGDYIDIAQGFRTTSIEQASANRWIISNNGALRTIRFDNESRSVDLAASRAVLGFMHLQGSLYVHLKGSDGAEIVLTDARPSAPYIAKANGTIDDWKSSGNKTSFTLNAIGRVHFVLGGMEKTHTYLVVARSKRYNMTSDSEGFLTFYIELPSRAYEDVKITIE
jgi:hypothetical protein